MPNALVGYTGFVGTTLRRQAHFDALYRSTNIGEIDGKSFDLVVCAAAQAQKWLANREPAADRAKIDSLIAHLDTVNCARFVLISTVDVFPVPAGVYEDTRPPDGGSPYGANRRHLESFIERRFPEHRIVRLPGLVGPGLRKNVLYDLLNGNNLSAIDSRSVFQFYPMVNLWADLNVALAMNRKLLHLTAEPISVRDVAVEGFGIRFERELAALPSRYDFRTMFSAHFGGTGDYQYDRRASLLAIRSYAQSEPRAVSTSESRSP